MIYIISGQIDAPWASRPLKIMALCTFETWGANQPLVQHHIPE